MYPQYRRSTYIYYECILLVRERSSFEYIVLSYFISLHIRPAREMLSSEARIPPHRADF